MKRLLLITLILFLIFGANRLALAKEKFNDGDQNWSQAKIKRYIDKKWAGREKDAKKAKAIFMAESGLNCKRSNKKSDDIGVAQINKMHWKRFGGKDALKSCKRNIDAAYTLYKEWGNSFKAWTAYNDGRYKQYMK